MSSKLSIITINYNNVQGLKKTMESVFCQISKDFEYIVIDGGSIDKSVEIIQQFNSRWLSGSSIPKFIWISENDTGIYNAMNKGIRMAKGEYVQFLNSGDTLVDSDVTEKMLSKVLDTPIYYGNKIKIFPDGRILYNKEIPNISMLTFFTGTLNHATAYIKKDLFEKYGYYDENFKIVSDWKFYLIAVGLNNETVKYIDVDLVYFDMSGISSTNTTLTKEERRKVLTELLPASILIDYERWSFPISQIKRINRYWLTRKGFWLVERMLFKWEKWFKYKDQIF